MKETAGNLSSTCSYEDGHIFKNNTVFFVFERYSTLGKNRVSLSITISLNSYEDKIELVAITSGGSQGRVMKLNTFGEQRFLDKFAKALENIEKSW